MFRRIAITGSMNDLALIAFAIFFVVFVIAVVCAFRLPAERINHLSQLPLDSDQSNDERHA